MKTTTSSNLAVTTFPPAPWIDAPDGWRILASGETVNYGDMSLELAPLRWAPVGRGGYLVKIGIYIRRMEAVAV